MTASFLKTKGTTMNENLKVRVGSNEADQMFLTIAPTGVVLALEGSETSSLIRHRTGMVIVGFTRFAELRSQIQVDDIDYTIDDLFTGMVALASFPIVKFGDSVFVLRYPVRSIEPAEYQPKHKAEVKA